MGSRGAFQPSNNLLSSIREMFAANVKQSYAGLNWHDFPQEPLETIALWGENR